MTRKLCFSLFALPALVLAACTAASSTQSPSAPSSGPNELGSDLVRTDAQGSVEFAVTPLNLTSPGKTLDFEVVMNTHSVELSWDLAAQSSLVTDTGLEVKGLSWPGGTGHHVEGHLTFPAETADGKRLLDGATKLTLIIRDAGAPGRTFEWEI